MKKRKALNFEEQEKAVELLSNAYIRLDDLAFALNMCENTVKSKIEFMTQQSKERIVIRYDSRGYNCSDIINAFDLTEWVSSVTARVNQRKAIENTMREQLSGNAVEVLANLLNNQLSTSASRYQA